MPDVRLLVVSDTHLSELTPEAVSNVEALVAQGFLSPNRLDESRAARARDAARVDEVKAQLARYRGANVVWAQEEPENMGAWRFLRIMFGEKLLKRFPFFYVSRSPSPSPAVGSTRMHKDEQAEILSRAFM